MVRWGSVASGAVVALFHYLGVAFGVHVAVFGLGVRLSVVVQYAGCETVVHCCFDYCFDGDLLLL